LVIALGESDPELGARDESYMDLTVQTRDKKTRVRIRLSETLSQAIEKNIVELARPDE
jgi:predicted DNA binding CopG/RHH family protein